MSDLTVFVGTFNRTDTLTRCFENLEAQDYPQRIVIVDNGSKDEAALSGCFDDLTTGYKVYRCPAIEDVPWQPRETMTAHGGQYHERRADRTTPRRSGRSGSRDAESKWFAVCDCDTAPEHPESLSTYVRLAEGLGCAVGPHLSLNVHRNYPLRSLDPVQHARSFRSHMMWWNGIPYCYDPIDTTFHLFPAARRSTGCRCSTARVGPPYWTHAHGLAHRRHSTRPTRTWRTSSGAERRLTGAGRG